MANKTFNTRVKNKRDTAANWEAVATTFQPLDGELIIVDTAAGKTRFKVGRYDTAKGRLLYYNEIPFTDEYLYNDLNESQGKIYDKLKGIDDKSIIESTLEPAAGADDKLYVYNIGLWQFPKTGFYKIKLTKVGALGILLKLYARITKDDGTTPDDWDNNNLKAMGNASGDGLIEEIYAQVDYINDDKFTVYRVQFFNCFGYLGSFWVNTYDKTTQKWAYDYKHRVTADHVSNDLTLTKGDVTTKFNGSVAREVSIPTKISELTNDSFVSYAEQTLTEGQQNQAKTNLGIDVLTGNTTTVTPTQVKEAIFAGRPVAITYTDTTYGNLIFTSFGYSLENNVVVANLVATSNGQYILADLTGIINTNGWTLQTTELGTSTDIANNYVKYSESQTLTNEQKAQARTNIDAISSSEVSSNYLSLDDTQELTEIQQYALRDKLDYINNLKVLSSWVEATEQCKKGSGHVLVIQDGAHSDGDIIPNIAGDAYPLLLIPARVRSTTQTFHGIDAYGNNYSCAFLYPSYKFSVTKYSMDQQTMNADPTEDMQIATKKYVDSAVGLTKFDIVLTLDTSKNKYVPTQTWDEIKAALEKSTDVKDYNLIVDGVYWSIERFVPDIASSIPGLYLQARNTYSYKTTTNPNNDEIVTLYKVTTIDYEIGQNINKVTSTDGAVTPYVENYVNIRKDDTGAFSCFPIHAIEYLFKRNLNIIPTLLYDTVYSLDGIEMTNNDISVAYFSAVSNSIYRRFKITKSTNDAADTVTIDKEIILLDKSDVLTKTNETAFTPTADYQPATKKYVDDSHIQSDWSQNDETAKDYIKNRPGAYFKTANNTVFTQNTSEITWTEKPNENAPDMGHVILDNIPEFVDGLEYKVHWGDTLYAVAAKYSFNGNDTAFEFGSSNGFTNYPFYIIFTFENGTNILGIVVENKTNIPSIFSIEGSTGLIKKIPEACIEPLDKQIRVFCDERNPSEYQIKRLYLSNIENKFFNSQDNYVYYVSDKNNPDCFNLKLGSDIPAYFDYRFYLSWGSTWSDWKPAIGKSKIEQTIKNTQSNISENKLLLNLYTYKLTKAYAIAVLDMKDTSITFNIYNDNLVSTSTRPQAIGFTVYDNILYRIVFTAKNFSTNGVVEYTVTSMCDLSNIASKSDIPTIDTVLSSTSENPVQNKVITTEIQEINNKLGGLTGAMHFIGKAAVDITDGSTTDPQIANYTTKEKGDVILGKDDHKEFVWNGAIWEELGDEGSYALKTTTINGKALSDNITLTASDVGAASASTIETMQAAIDSKPSAADAVYTATAESTDGVAYTATVSGIDSLTVGASFIMIPNKASTSKAPTLNVNGLGAKPIRRRLSSLTTSLQQGYSTNWIALNKPFTVVYDGTAWVIEGLTKTDGADVYGAVAQATADAKGNNIADTYATIAMLQSLLPKVTTITLTSNWVGDASPYYQDIALSCVTETSIVDLQPTPEQLNSWQDDGIAFTTLSGNGTVRVYVAGGKPSSAISVQVRVQEVTVI